MASPALNPFNGIQGAISLKAMARDKKYKIAIIGKGKSGKSWFAASAPGSIMYYDFDERWMGLMEHKNIDNIQLKVMKERNQSKPSSIKSLETDLSTFQAMKIKGQPVPDTYVFDTVTFMIQALEAEAFEANKDLYRKVKMGNRELRVGAGWDYYRTIEAYIQYFMTEFSALGNVIFVFHEKDEEDKTESSKERKAYTGQVTINPQFLITTLTLFNEVFRIEAITGVNDSVPTTYTVTCRPTGEVRASTTLLVDAKEPPDLMAMIAKSEAARAKR